MMIVAIQLDDGEVFAALATRISERIVAVRTERVIACGERVLIIFANPLAYDRDMPAAKIPVIEAAAVSDLYGARFGDPLSWQHYRVTGWQ